MVREDDAAGDGVVEERDAQLRVEVAVRGGRQREAAAVEEGG